MLSIKIWTLVPVALALVGVLILFVGAAQADGDEEWENVKGAARVITFGGVLPSIVTGLLAEPTSWFWAIYHHFFN